MLPLAVKATKRLNAHSEEIDKVESINTDTIEFLITEILIIWMLYKIKEEVLIRGVL